DAILRSNRRDDARAARIGNEVNRLDAIARLADSPRAAIALIELHRIPWNVVVHHHAGPLQIQTLGREIGADQIVDASASKAIERIDRMHAARSYDSGV